MSSAVESLNLKLRDLAGGGKLADREWKVRCRLNWHRKSKSAVRHLLHGEQRPSLQEAKQIEAAHLRWCGEKLTGNIDENQRLLNTIRTALDAMERTDSEFYRETIEGLREALSIARHVAGPPGSKNSTEGLSNAETCNTQGRRTRTAG